MIGKVPKSDTDQPYIDPKDYVLSEESIKALTELAMLVREIKIQQALDEAYASTHHEDKFKNRKTHPEGHARRRVS